MSIDPLPSGRCASGKPGQLDIPGGFPADFGSLARPGGLEYMLRPQLLKALDDSMR